MVVLRKQGWVGGGALCSGSRVAVIKTGHEWEAFLSKAGKGPRAFRSFSNAPTPLVFSSWALHGDAFDGRSPVSHMGFTKVMLMVFCPLSKICRLPRLSDTRRRGGGKGWETGGGGCTFCLLVQSEMCFIDPKCSSAVPAFHGSS